MGDIIDALFNVSHSLTESFGGSAISNILPIGVSDIRKETKEDTPQDSYDKDKKEGSGRFIYCKDSSFVTMFEIHGTKHHYNSEMTRTALLRFANSIKSSMKEEGHTLQICMHHDRKRAPAILNALMDPMERAAKALNIDTKIITDDWKKVLAQYTAGEFIYIVAWTHPDILVPSILKEEKKKKEKRVQASSIQSGCQNPLYIIEALDAKHTTIVSNINTALNATGLVFTEYGPEKATRAMRSMLDEEFTHPEWKPWLQEGTNTMPSMHKAYDDFSHEWFMPESLSHQIAPREAQVIDDKMVLIGNRLHYPFLTELMPQEIIGFRNGFFNEAITHSFPWRITWTLRGGQKISRLNSAIAQVCNLFSATNKKINNAYAYMKDYMENQDGTAITAQITYDTWVDTPLLSREDIAKVKTQQSQFAGAIQAWGTQQVVNITGDPYKALISSIPGLNWQSPAVPTLLPIEDAFSLMPLMDRAASPWESGIPLRTPDGKVYPYNPMSTKQAAWVTFGVAPMGQGKSVYANVENYSFIFNPDLPDVPYLYIIDVGASSSGLIKMIQESLPKNKKHLACGFTLDDNIDQSINLFDTELGCREPFSEHLSFLENFIVLLATPVNEKDPYDGIKSFAKLCIEHAYRMTGKVKPKVYKTGLNKEIDEWLINDGYKITSKTTWWQIVDHLFASGEKLLAGKAQRHAVPLLEDIGAASNESTIRTGYLGIEMPTKESLPDFFFRRIQDSLKDFPVLSGYTRFDIGEARIASIDLDRFKSPGAEGEKRMAIMFMAAQQVMAGKFYQDETDLVKVPALYKEHQRKRIKSIKELPKRLSMDEVHRITKSKGAVASQFVGDICTRARESRKWGVSFSFWSQIYEDIPEEIIALTTTLYIFGVANLKEAEKIAQTYGMTPEIANAMTELPPPGSQGSSLLAYFKTKDAKPYYHILTLTIGLYMLWALSSTKNERNIRDILTKEFGFGKALSILVKKYPQNISGIIEERQRELSNRGESGDVVADIIKECIEYGKSM